ncbi:hypothetical protein [Clostridium sp. USBA 49]|nr:hypothetical protein [Clostridium sp. USBA 49]
MEKFHSDEDKTFYDRCHVELTIKILKINPVEGFAIYYWIYFIKL